MESRPSNTPANVDPKQLCPRLPQHQDASPESSTLQLTCDFAPGTGCLSSKCQNLCFVGLKVWSLIDTSLTATGILHVPWSLSVQSVSASLAASSWTLFQHSDHHHHCPSHHWRGHTTRNSPRFDTKKHDQKSFEPILNGCRIVRRICLCSAWVSFWATGPQFAWYLTAFAEFGAKICYVFSLYVQHVEASISCLQCIYSILELASALCIVFAPAAICMICFAAF